VALLSDAIDNGCQECGFSRVRASLWRTTAPIVNLNDARSAMATPPTATIEANERYELPLDRGDYLLCSGKGIADSNPCASFSLTTDKPTTVNIKLRKGLTSLLVFDADSASPRPETFDFSAR
jgi:hypothetical protein